MNRMNEAGKLALERKVKRKNGNRIMSINNNKSWFVMLLLACCDRVVACHNVKTVATGDIPLSEYEGTPIDVLTNFFLN